MTFELSFHQNKKKILKENIVKRKYYKEFHICLSSNRIITYCKWFVLYTYWNLYFVYFIKPGLKPESSQIQSNEKLHINNHINIIFVSANLMTLLWTIDEAYFLLQINEKQTREIEKNLARTFEKEWIKNKSINEPQIKTESNFWFRRFLMKYIILMN